MTQIVPPSYSNDAGDGQSGTAMDVAWFDAWAAAINAVVHSATNPTIAGKDVIDEVKNARGSLANLDTRLDVSLNEDGTLKTQANLVTTAQAKTMVGAVNFIPNGDFLIWSQGDSAAPDYWVLSGAGATIARTGTGLGDTQRAKYGDFAVKLTYGSAAAKLTQTLLSVADFARADGLKNRKVSFGVWAKTSIANHASIVVDDGITQTRGGVSGNGTYHSGGGSLEWLYVTHTMSASATKLTVYVETAAAGSAYFGDVCGFLSEIPPADFTPCPMRRGQHVFFLSGNLVAAVDQANYFPEAAGIVTDVSVIMKTAPTGADAIFDVNTWDGAAYTSMYTAGGRPKVTAASSIGSGFVPDTTYARRCFAPLFSSHSAGTDVDLDVDQIGSGTPGANAYVFVRFRQYVRMLESLLAWNAF